MILIQRYIFKELVYNYIFTFVVLSMIILLVLAVQVIFKHPAFGLLLLLKNTPLMLLAALNIILPCAVLVTTVITYTRIAADNEIVTMRASGIHILRIFIPGILLGLLTSLVLVVVNDRYVPRAEHYIKNALTGANLSIFLDAQLKRGKKEYGWKDWLLTWDSCKRDEESASETGEYAIEKWRFFGLRAKQSDGEGNTKLDLLADRAQIAVENQGKKLVLTLMDVEVIYGAQKGTKVEVFRLPALDLESRKHSKVRLKMRGLAALLAMKGRMYKGYDEHEVETEIHKRISDSLSPLVFMFLCLPVSILFSQQNRLVAFLISILLALIIYYPVSFLGETFAKMEYLTPALCLWPGNILLIFLGVAMTLKVMRR